MKIIIVHNYYQQPGGEDQSFISESKLLESRGHNVIRYTMHNNLIADMNPFQLMLSTFWNKRALNSIRNLIRCHSPEVIHFHNTFPLISPASYYAKNRKGTVVIQTLHNYRLFCPGALFIRNGNTCEKCLGKLVAWPGAVNACYRDSVCTSGVTVAMLAFHRLLGTWGKKVDRFIALTEFSKQKFIQGGLPSAKIVTKPNFVLFDPGTSNNRDNFALFVGRLSGEKGLITMLNAWKHIGPVPLKIVGCGPLEKKIKNLVLKENLCTVEIIGQLPQNEIINLMKKANYFLFPSNCYEGFPNTLAEAFACGLPIIASKLGSMAEIVEDGVTGLHFEAGNSADLADKIKYLIDYPHKCRQMGENARRVYLEKYSADTNYKTLMNIYHETIFDYR